MKPTHTTIDVKGNLPNAGRRMDFDPESIAHIMRLLIDLYSDKELAIIRELSTNAYDSHVEAGKAHVPIRVQLPTSLSPYLVIKDEGIGLSIEEVFRLLGQYGASTKRGSNDFNGMLGLGSKSPLTYTNQYTMTVVKDQLRSVIAVTRDEDGVGNLTEVGEPTPTDLPNGVEIKIPAKAGNTLRQKAETFFAYWKPGTVLLDGKDPTGLKDAMEVTPTISLLKDHLTSVVVMGNVAYPAPELSQHALGVPYGYRVVAYVPIGAVKFAPSREGLQESKETRAALDRITTDFKQGIANAAQKDIDKAATASDALRVMLKWTELYSNSGQQRDFQWKGRTIPYKLEVPTKQVRNRYGSTSAESTQRIFQSNIYEHGSRRRGAVSTVWSVPSQRLLDSLIVVNYDYSGEPTTTLRKKVSHWVKQNYKGLVSPRIVIWMDYIPDELYFVDDSQIVKFADIKDLKLPKAATGVTGRIPGSYDIVEVKPGVKWQTGREGVPGSDIDQNFPVFWTHGNCRHVIYNIVPTLAGIIPQYTIICLPENRIEKFKRENPSIINARDEMERQAKLAAAKLSKDELNALAMHDLKGVSDNLETLQLFEAEILDPDVVEGIRLSRIDVTNASKLRNRFLNVVRFAEGKFADPLKRYPLINIGGVYQAPLNTHPEHCVRYMNAEYLHGKKAKKGSVRP